MIREIIVDIREGDDSVGKQILDAITREINIIALENDGINQLNYGFDAERMREMRLITLSKEELPKFPGHVVINVFDENEELMEIVET